TDFCAVPLTVKRLMMTEEGKIFLRSLHGGVIGGASIDQSLADFLETTRLRVGYGQTEASPGIALGEPGYFPRAHYLGRALGCEVGKSDEQTLLFRGANTCMGQWAPHAGFTALKPNRWHDSGDIITDESNGDLFLVGRSDSAFKLANGRRIEPEPVEDLLRSVDGGAEHLFLFSEDNEHLIVASSIPLSMNTVTIQLGSLAKLLSRIIVVPPEIFHYTPKGTLQRNATRDALRSHMLQFDHGNDSRLYRSIRCD
ncbi:MAG: AMP-binding protein, partial [Fibrella sp.]|nr:AMP-binding protein [Armatimonadota bacterium]